MAQAVTSVTAMIVWRGLGALGLAMALAGFAVGMMVWSGLGAPAKLPLLCGGAGMMLGSVGAWFVAQWRNNDEHRRHLNESLAQHRAQVNAMVQQGVCRGPQGQVPTSAAEAHGMAQAQLAGEEEVTIRGWENRDTLYGIPMRFTAIGLGVIGLIVFGIGIGQAVS